MGRVEEIVKRFEEKLHILNAESKKQLESLRKADNVELECNFVESLVNMYQKAGHYQICIEFIKRKEVIGGPEIIEAAPDVKEEMT